MAAARRTVRSILAAFLDNDDGNVMTAGGQARCAGTWSQRIGTESVDPAEKFISVLCGDEVDPGRCTGLRCVPCSNRAARHPDSSHASAAVTSSRARGEHDCHLRTANGPMQARRRNANRSIDPPMGKLRANDTMIVQGHQQVFSIMQQGERVIGAEGADPRSVTGGKEVPSQRMIYPTEGVFIVSSPTAVIKGARNSNAAKLFAQFMVSPVAQQMIAEGGIHSSRVDMAPPRGQPALGDMKFIPVDLDLIEERSRELKARFAEIFQ
jgi:hypothetical protein